ncbi:MAG: ABC transporter ATP-binding protein [Candidatus Zixiibacteriota bacterium]
MTTQLIQIRQLHKSFEGNRVLSGLDFGVGSGESIVVIGQSGCGKSVLLKHLIGLMGPDSGTVSFDGVDIPSATTSQLASLRGRIGMLFQSAALFDSMTVEENVGLGLTESRMHTDSEVHEKVMEKLKMVALEDTYWKRPSELSGGMRKRVGLARAIATNPEVLLYDEPTTGLDPITADMINRMIVDLHQKLNVTSITVTHDMTSAYKIGQRIIMIYDGSVRFDGSPDEIRASDDAVVRQFITGSSVGPVTV